MHISAAIRSLESDLQQVFGPRLRSLVVYQHVSGDERAATPTLAMVEDLRVDDLHACAVRTPEWREAGLATPLLLPTGEFGRSLDVFPFEFGGILADYTVVSGADPFEGLRVDPADLRRACEIQARGHLLHLREGYLETEGRGHLLAELIVDSATPLAALVKNVARLEGASGSAAAGELVERAANLPEGSLTEVVNVAARGSLAPEAARRLFPVYLHAVEKLAAYIDRWRAA
jgi:hypothetical protein